MTEIDHPLISISFDEMYIILKYETSGFKYNVKKFNWEMISKICYKSFNHVAPDLLYLSLKNETEKFIIPISEEGGNSFWEEVKNRGLFDQKLAIIAEGSWNQIFCWPD